MCYRVVIFNIIRWQHSHIVDKGGKIMNKVINRIVDSRLKKTSIGMKDTPEYPIYLELNKLLRSNGWKPSDYFMGDSRIASEWTKGGLTIGFKS